MNLTLINKNNEKIRENFTFQPSFFLLTIYKNSTIINYITNFNKELKTQWNKTNEIKKININQN